MGWTTPTALGNVAMLLAVLLFLTIASHFWIVGVCYRRLDQANASTPFRNGFWAGLWPLVWGYQKFIR